MSVTISEIADKLGVSPMTVSRALRGVGRIGADTRQRVLEAARKYGYRPNLSARAMRSGRFGCVAFVVGPQALTRGLSHDLLWGIEDALEAKGLYLAVTRLPDEQRAAGGHIPAILSQWMTDGLLVNCACPIPATMVEQIHTRRVPAIWIHQKRDTDCVYPDDVDAGQRGTEYLLSLGHNRIAYADYSSSSAWKISASPSASKARFDGYALAMRAAGLEPRSLDGVTTEDRRISYSRAVLSAADRPTAVFTSGFQPTASPFFAAAALLGLQVPQDLSLLTVEPSPVSDWDLQIATMVLPDREIGRTAVQMLLEKLTDPEISLAGRSLPMELVTGNSCLPPRTESKRTKAKK